MKGLFLIASAALAVTAQAHDLVCHVSLNGPNESPANNSPASATATVTIDFDLFTMRVEVSFNNLQGTVTSAHIHAATVEEFSGTAGIATQADGFASFPVGLTSGSYDHTFDLADASSYNPDFITANGGTISTASNALFKAIVKGKAYLDIHTTAFADGEIRGFLIGPKIVITSIATTPNGAQNTIALRGTVEPFGAGVLLQKSSDLQNWNTVTDGGSDFGTGAFSFNTSENTTVTKQFYLAIDLLEPPGEPRPARTK